MINLNHGQTSAFAIPPDLSPGEALNNPIYLSGFRGLGVTHFALAAHVIGTTTGPLGLPVFNANLTLSFDCLTACSNDLLPGDPFDVNIADIPGNYQFQGFNGLGGKDGVGSILASGADNWGGGTISFEVRLQFLPASSSYTDPVTLVELPIASAVEINYVGNWFETETVPEQVYFTLSIGISPNGALYFLGSAGSILGLPEWIIDSLVGEVKQYF